MKPPKVYLQKRPENGIWYFRRPIPKELQAFVKSGNKREFVISLKSKSQVEARRLHHDYWTESERVLEEARAQAKAAKESGCKVARKRYRPTSKQLLSQRPVEEFSRDELRALVQRWYQQAEAQTLAHYRLLFSEGDGEERQTARGELESELNSLQRKSGASVDILTPATKRKIIEDAGGFITHIKGAGFMPVDSWFGQLVREGLIRLRRYAAGILETGTPPLIEDASPELSAAALRNVSNHTNSTTLDALINQYENDPDRKGVKPKTRDEFKLVYQMMREAFGKNTPLSDITRAQVKAIRALYAELPARSSFHYPRKSIKEAVALGKRDGRRIIATATFNKRMTLLTGIFRYAVKEQLMASSPAEGLTLADDPKQEGEKSYSTEQLNRIFQDVTFQDFARDQAARFTPNHPLNPHEFWAPLIALYHGMRMEEILQLRTQDIAPVEDLEGVSELRIHAGKNKQSLKPMPLHPQVETFGLLQYRDAMAKMGQEFLFPEAKRGKTYGNRSHNYSKRFAELLKRIGIKDGRNQVFHSFRHTFIDALRMARLSDYAVYRLSRHAGRKTSNDGYGGKVSKLLADEIAKVEYPGLDLSHLKLISSK